MALCIHDFLCGLICWDVWAEFDMFWSYAEWIVLFVMYIWVLIQKQNLKYPVVQWKSENDFEYGMLFNPEHVTHS